MKNKQIIIIFGSLAILLLGLSQCEQKEIVPLSKSWEIAVPNQEVPEGLASLSAEHCRICHQEHYDEWKLSTHAHAWTDLQFQAELKKESSPFMCINCHIPLQNQQEYIVTGLVNGDIYQPIKEKNPHFDPALQQEGINCASCHVRDGAIIGPTGTLKAPHKTIKDPEFLSEKLCISCHNATAVITPTLACSFETGDEWKAGPYFKEKNCISCHMETVEREIVRGFGKRKSYRHFFAGSGIPKFDTVETKMLNGLAIYPSKLKPTYKIGDSLRFEVMVKNEFAGHKVPTGDPERFFIIHMSLLNTTGDTLAQQIDRIGEHWQWYPTVKKISDNNLLPMEERVFVFKHRIQFKKQMRLSVKVHKHRLNKEAAAYNKLNHKYPLSILIFDEEYAINM